MLPCQYLKEGALFVKQKKQTALLIVNLSIVLRTAKLYLSRVGFATICNFFPQGIIPYPAGRTKKAPGGGLGKFLVGRNVTYAVTFGWFEPGQGFWNKRGPFSLRTPEAHLQGPSCRVMP